MEKPIVKDVMFLSQKCQEAQRSDLGDGIDLIDTLNANRRRCIGLAANMIGIRKRIIVAAIGPVSLVMFNPVIVRKSGEYETEEGCLSLEGTRKTKRWKNITVEYLDMSWKKQRQDFSGLPAETLQHEIDHLNGILI